MSEPSLGKMNHVLAKFHKQNKKQFHPLWNQLGVDPRDKTERLQDVGAPPGALYGDGGKRGAPRQAVDFSQAVSKVREGRENIPPVHANSHSELRRDFQYNQSSQQQQQQRHQLNGLRGLAARIANDENVSRGQVVDERFEMQNRGLKRKSATDAFMPETRRLASNAISSNLFSTEMNFAPSSSKSQASKGSSPRPQNSYDVFIRNPPTRPLFSHKNSYNPSNAFDR